MALKVASRSRIAPFIVMDVMREANAREAGGADVLHLEVGQPSTPAPAPVVEAARAALSSERLGYTEALGIEPLRRRIALSYGENHDLDVDWRRVAVTAGSSAAFVLGFLAAFEAGDRVAMACPGYPCYRHILAALGVEVVPLPVGPEERFQPSPAVLDRVKDRLDGLVIASPTNPTGTMLMGDELRDLAQDCRDRGIRLVSDEIYHGITYGTAAETALAFDDRVIAVNSFSKYYSMTGWRLGWMVLPEDLIRPVECLAQNLFIAPATLSQHGALAAFDCRELLDLNVARYRTNRDLLLNALPQAGFPRLAPADGAFYLYADVRDRTEDSSAFCRRMLAETGVAVTPGIDFDPDRGHRTLRISFAGSLNDVAEAARRLLAWAPA
jgi:aspartate/methionine/tyrosine aminotransferase